MNFYFKMGFLWLSAATAAAQSAPEESYDATCAQPIEYSDHVMVNVAVDALESGEELFSNPADMHVHLVVGPDIPEAWEEALIGKCPGQSATAIVENPTKDFTYELLPAIPPRLLQEHEGPWKTTMTICNVTSAEDYQIFEHIGNRSLTEVQNMIDSGRGLNAIDAFGYTPLMLALSEERSHFHTTLFGILLNLRGEERVDINAQKATGHTAIYHAVAQHDVMKLKALLRRGAKTDVAILSGGKYKGFSPLHLAAFLGKTRFVETLLDFGADPMAEADKGATALEVARWNEENVDRYLDDLSDLLLQAARRQRTVMQDR